MGVVVLLESISVLLSRVREPAGRDDHPAFRPSKSNVAIAGWSFWTTGRPTVPMTLALHDDRAPGAVDDLLHNTSRPSSAVRYLADVLEAEVAEDVLHHVLELEP